MDDEAARTHVAALERVLHDDLATALTNCEQALVCQPAGLGLQELYVEILVMSDRSEDAARYIENEGGPGLLRTKAPVRVVEALAACGESPAALRLGSLVLTAGAESAELLIALGLALFQRGDLGGAANRLQQACHMRPDNARALSALGSVRLIQGDVESAIAKWREALQLVPADSEIQLALGSLLLLKGRADESVPLLRASVRSPDSHLLLCYALRLTGRVDEAWTEWVVAARSTPGRALFPALALPKSPLLQKLMSQSVWRLHLQARACHATGMEEQVSATWEAAAVLPDERWREMAQVITRSRSLPVLERWADPRGAPP